MKRVQHALLPALHFQRGQLDMRFGRSDSDYGPIMSCTAVQPHNPGQHILLVMKQEWKQLQPVQHPSRLRSVLLAKSLASARPHVSRDTSVSPEPARVAEFAWSSFEKRSSCRRIAAD